MSTPNFDKSFTQQETIPDEAAQKALAVLKSGRLHRYNTAGDETGETADWEKAYAAYQGAAYCLATSSGGAAMQIALRAAGVEPGQGVLTNAFTLAPVPGAIAAVRAEPIYVETTDQLTLDLDDLDRQFAETGAKVFLMSHMRGHIAPMEEVCAIVERHGATLIEDCAHTMGATWNGTKSGNFGKAACFSTQTYKHLNSGEGGLLTTNDGEFMARAIILSGSYMLYDRHIAAPDQAAFDQARLMMPNCSMRMDNLRAAILLPQLDALETNIERWNSRYRIIEERLSQINGISLPNRPEAERYVGSSIQFLLPEWQDADYKDFVAACRQRGVELKWFGDGEPAGYTSRYDSWQYAKPQHLRATLDVLRRVFDMRIPLSFSEDDCKQIAEIIAEEYLAMSTDG